MYHVNFDIELKRYNYSGKFVVIEGIDGSGKTTQVEKILKILNSKDIKAIETKEPTDGPVGKLIRQMLLGKVAFSKVAFQYLFAADRVMHMEEVLELLKKGYLVVSDRYFWSAIAYGMADKEGLDYKNAKEISLVAQSLLSMYHQFIVPDYTFFLKISVDTAVSRLSGMDKEKEIYEKKEKLEKINFGYEWLVKKFSKEIIIIDGEKAVEEVTEDIISNLKF